VDFDALDKVFRKTPDCKRFFGDCETYNSNKGKLYKDKQEDVKKQTDAR